MLSSCLLALILLASCDPDTDPGDHRATVVATTSILGDIASHVLGQQGSIEVLIPVGIDSHDFQPSARQTVILAGADLVVANGLGLEQGMADVLASLASDGANVIEVAPMLDPIPFAGGEVDDPHFWMDPDRVGRAAAAIAGELAELHLDGAWEDHARAYAAEMTAADKTVRGLLEAIPEQSRRIVTNHEAFGYFADRYGFEVIGVVIPGGSTLAEPSSAELAALVAVMQREGVRVIFAETSQPTTLADAVAAEIEDEVTVVELFTETLGPAGSGAETLADMLITNAERIAAALE
ncbi:MAG: metal ABC transporter solute-binding protein, Zn/Mn family [Acidimicrobiia bacterium]